MILKELLKHFKKNQTIIIILKNKENKDVFEFRGEINEFLTNPLYELAREVSMFNFVDNWEYHNFLTITVNLNHR